MATKTSKSSLELRKKIKDIEKKKRSKTLKKVEVKIVKADDDKKKISFDQWWMMVNRKVSLKSWMKEILVADFGARGLGKQETEEKYNQALVQYGIKL